jgi:hypothetical protein
MIQFILCEQSSSCNVSPLKKAASKSLFCRGENAPNCIEQSQVTGNRKQTRSKKSRETIPLKVMSSEN